MIENKRFYLDETGINDREYEFSVLGEDELVDIINQLNDENKQLKSELLRYKEVNRLDIWKSSYNSEDILITRLQDKCDEKQAHIVVLENKIRRMREAIHKLEWLATHRNADLQRENGQLKKQIDELTSEFEGYYKSLEEIKDYDKQFEVTDCPYEIRNNKSMDYYWLEHQGNVIGICNMLNEQSDKINELQERNDRQAETIRKLYTLIENKDWKGLTAHMEELDKYEEQLRKEWRFYSE